MYGEHYVFGVPHPTEEEEGEVEGWDADMGNAEVGKLLPVESALIRRLRVTKYKLVVSISLFSLPTSSVALCGSLSLSLSVFFLSLELLSPFLNILPFLRTCWILHVTVKFCGRCSPYLTKTISTAVSPTPPLSLSLQEATRREEQIAAGLIVEDGPQRPDRQNAGRRENRRSAIFFAVVMLSGRWIILSLSTRWYNRLLRRPQNDPVRQSVTINVDYH